MKESLFKNNNQVNSTIRTRTWVLWTKWTRIWLITVLVSEWKNGVCLNGVLKYVRVLYHINKVWWVYAFSSFWKRCCQCNFSEIFKGRQSILKPCKNSKYFIRCLFGWHKKFAGAIWTQAYSQPLQTSSIECFWINT